MRKIVLLCSGGMSSSALELKMMKAAKQLNYEVSVAAHGIAEAVKYGLDADVILIAPQVRYGLETVRSRLPNKIVEVIGMRDYGTMDGLALIHQVQELLGDT